MRAEVDSYWPTNAVPPADAHTVLPDAAESGTEPLQVTLEAQDATSSVPAVETAPAEAPAKPLVRPVVVARRGDDRPGQQREAAPAAGTRRGGERGGPGARDGARSGAPRGPGSRSDGPGEGRGFGRGSEDLRGGRFDSPESAPPRLGDAAFRAQREALEGAEQVLKRMAVQAQRRDASRLGVRLAVL
jgi:hypothetical protein